MDDELKLLLALNVQATGQAVLSQIGQQLDQITKAAGLLKVAFMGIGAGAIAFGLAADQAAHWQTTITQVANNTNMSTGAMNAMSDAILQMAQTTSAPLDQLADGYMHVTNMGFQGKDAIDVLNAAMESAVSTGGNVADTANVLANVMHEFALPAADAAHAMDVLHTAAALGNMTLEQMTNSFGPVAAIAATVGVPLNEAAAAMSAMTRHGFDAAEAGTQVKNVIEKLAAPTANARKEMALLSQTTGVDLVGAYKGFAAGTVDLTGLLEQVAKATNGNFEAFNQLLGGAQLTTAQLNALADASHGNLAALQALDPNIRGLYALFVLTGRGAGDYLDILNQVNESTKGAGITAESYARTQQTVGFQVDVLRNTLQVAAIELGQHFLPAITGVVQWITTTGIPVFEQLSSDLGDKVGPAIATVGDAFNALESIIANNGIMGALEQLGTNIIDFAANLFADGWNLVVTLANGMMQAAQSVLTEVVNEIAGVISSFLSGNSPPPVGPLSHIDKDGTTLMQTYAQGMQAGALTIQQVAQQTAQLVQGMLSVPDIASAKQAFDAVAGSLTDVASNAAQAKQDIANIQPAIDANKNAVNDLNDAIKTVTDSYNAQIDPLQQQLTLLQQQVDYTTQIADAQDKLTLAQIDQQLLQAQGDPVKRAQLQAELDKNKLLEQGYSLTSQIASIEAQKKQSAGDPAKLADLNLKEQDLQIQQQMLGLVDQTKVATLDSQKQQITNTDALRNAQQAVTDAQRKAAELPLEQKIAALKAQEQAQLEPLKNQLLILQQQGTQLTNAENTWKGIVGQIGTANGKLGGGGLKTPALGGLGIPATPGTNQAAVDFKAEMDSNIQQATASMVDKSKAAAQAWVKAFETGIQNHLDDIKGAFATLPDKITSWLGATFEHLQAAVVFSPLVNKLGPGFQSALISIISGKDVPQNVQKGLVSAFDDVPWADIGNTIAAHVQTWVSDFVAWVPGATAALPDTVGGLVNSFGDWLGGPAAKRIGTALAAWGDQFIEFVGPAILNLVTEFGRQLPKFLLAILLAVPYIMTNFQSWVDAFVGWIAPAAKRMGGEFFNLLGSLLHWIDSVASPAIMVAFIAVGGALVQGLLEGLADLGQQLTDQITQAIKSININIGPFHLSASGGFHIDAPAMPSISIPGFASGTSSAPGGLALVGESGPELINLPRGASVTPVAGIGGLAAATGGAGGTTIYITGNYLLSNQGITDLATQVGQVLARQTRQSYSINRIQ